MLTITHQPFSPKAAMLSSISTALSTMIRTQSAPAPAGIVALKSNQQATQAIITELQKGADTSKQQFPIGPNSALPRGSLVNIVV